MRLFLFVFALCSSLKLPLLQKITHPVFPNVSFVFHDSYDPFDWRLTKPDFLQLQKTHPDDSSPPVIMFYMRKSDSAPSEAPITESKIGIHRFYSTNCTYCQVWASYSFDGGLEWKTPFPFLDLPTNYPTLDPSYGWWARAGLRVALQQYDGVSSLHFGLGKLTEDHLALLHFSTNGSLSTNRVPIVREIFSHAQLIMPTKVASIPHTPIIVNQGKRLLFPIHYVARSPDSFYGLANTTVFYSDNFGNNWSESSPELVVPGRGDGANEPAIIELLNGTLWMLIRANEPVMYESYSYDYGTTWSTPSPTRFASYSSPAHLIRLSAKKKPGILVIWNNGFVRKEVEEYAEARQVIHGAVSYDEGSTWQGFRELYRDPHMDEVYEYGDHGSAYPTGKEMANGNVVVSTGQGALRQTVFVFDPKWLTETQQYTTIDSVATFNDTLNYDGNYFTSYGVDGVSRILDPTNTSCSRNLSVIQFDSRGSTNPLRYPTVVYNFPGLKRGRLAFVFYPASDGFSASVKILDFFSPPNVYIVDESASFVFNVYTDCGSSPRNGPCVSVEEWHEVELDWDVDTGRCNVTFDGLFDHGLELPIISRTFVMQPSYFRLQVSGGIMYLRDIEVSEL